LNTMQKLSLSKKMTIGAMVVALTVLFLYAGSVFIAFDIACFFLSSVFIYALACERAFAVAGIAYLASGLLAFFLLPNKLIALGYLVIWGHYGIIKYVVDTRIENKVIRAVVKIIYLDVLASIAVLLFILFFGGIELTEFTSFPIWVIVLALQVIWFLYDWLYQLCVRIYSFRIRPLLIYGKR